MNFLRKSLLSLRIILDILIISITFLISNYIIYNLSPYNFPESIFVVLMILIISWFFSSIITFLYDEFRYRNFVYEILGIFKNVFIQSFTLLLIILLFDNTISQKLIFIFPTVLFPSLLIEKQILRLLLSYIRKKGRNLRNIIIVGINDYTIKLYHQMRKFKDFGYNALGFIGDATNANNNIPVLASSNNIQDILISRKIHDVIVSIPSIDKEKAEYITSICENNNVNIIVMHEHFDIFLGSYSSKFISNPFMSLRQDKINELHWRIFKRIFDIFFSLCFILFVFSWLYPIIALIIKLESKGSILFKQQRNGKDNRSFYIYKFRTMHSESKDLDENNNFKQAIKNDPRLTRIGAWLRKTSIDELPQFINVLKGEMSIIGPRPHPFHLNSYYINLIPNYNLRHIIKPGITGWAQIKGFRGPTHQHELMQKRIEHDLWYLNNWSFTLDIKIVIISVWLMLRGDKNAF